MGSGSGGPAVFNIISHIPEPDMSQPIIECGADDADIED
jgi:hypothetical protein